MKHYVAGIDTGGTYTDAAIIETGARRLIAKAKALTTRGDLAIGVGEALTAALHAARAEMAAGEIRLVSLSTTLATNAIVEGHGAPVGVILIGFDAAMEARSGIAAAMPTARIARIGGGHDHGGGEAAPLDIEAMRAFLGGDGAGLDAYAIAAHYSVRNPAHEQAAGTLVAELTDRPVSLSHDLAQALDAPRRALTAALNARIIGRIAALIAAVAESLGKLGIDAPLMIVKGDGSLAPAGLVAARPVETILSGPAASVVGARFLSGRDDFIVADMGGTTTDIAVVENGQPKLAPDGARVGGLRTMVRAIAMHSHGLGGDSEVTMDAAGDIGIGPRRVVPLALLATRFPAVEASLRAMLAATPPPRAGFVLRPFGGDSRPSGGLQDSDHAFVLSLGEGPRPLGEVAARASTLRVVERLVRAGALQLAAFTPSDAAHVLRRQGQWRREASVLGALLLARRPMLAPPDERDEAPALALSSQVAEAMTRHAARLLIGALAGAAPVSGDSFVEAAARGLDLGHLHVRIAPRLPLVAVGGPAPVFFPAIAARLGCDLVLCADGDAANAIGAAVGLVRARAVVEITSPGAGQWALHDGSAPRTFDAPDLALTAACARARLLAQRMLARLGGREAADIEVSVQRSDIPGMPGDQGLVAALVVAESLARPKGATPRAKAAAP